MTVVYYIQWHSGAGCVLTRCFNSAAEREEFRRRIDHGRAGVRMWTKAVTA